jgi:predicted site-specific integrase-resolvase
LSEYLTVRKAAQMLGVSVSTLRNWDRRCKLQPVRHPLNGYRLYRLEDLEAILSTVAKECPMRRVQAARQPLPKPVAPETIADQRTDGLSPVEPS